MSEEFLADIHRITDDLAQWDAEVLSIKSHLASANSLAGTYRHIDRHFRMGLASCAIVSACRQLPPIPSVNEPVLKDTLQNLGLIIFAS